MQGVYYLSQVRWAIVESVKLDGGVVDAESLLANLSARGLIVVEVPPGVEHRFVGLVPQ